MSDNDYGWVMVVEADGEAGSHEFVEVIGPFGSYVEAERVGSGIALDADQHKFYCRLRREPWLAGLATRAREEHNQDSEPVEATQGPSTDGNPSSHPGSGASNTDRDREERDPASEPEAS